MPPSLRPYQSDGIADIRSAYTNGAQSVLYCLPTGGGKTFMFCHIAAAAARHGTRTCILVHRDTLLRQASAALSAYGVPHGIIAPGHTPTDDLVHVASVHTLARRLARHRFDLLIFDEAHHAVAGTWRAIVSAHPDAHILGVSATPTRTDGHGLDDVFQVLVEGPGIQSLISDGYLVRPRLFPSRRQLDLVRVHITRGDYDRQELADVMDQDGVTGDAVEEYARHCPGVPAVVFCVSVAHSEHVAARFQAAGYRAASINGRQTAEQIHATVAGLASGTVQVLTSCDLISEGFDCPVVQAAILLRPTQSESLYIQQGGRALRPAPGKECAWILDHAGNCFRHGLLQDVRDWSLSGRKRRAGQSGLAVPVRQCPKCFCCHHPATVCPECGYIYTVDERRADWKAGHLEEVHEEEMRLIQEARRRARLEVARARTLPELHELARARGYAPAWASIIYQQRGGR